MNCPTCKTELKMSERSGVEIDYCPQCRGVWLDRGELDKIIERAGQQPQGDAEDFRRPAYRDSDDYRDQPPYQRRKRSFLGDMFDFD